MRAISRIEGVSINTVTKMLVALGHACEQFHDSAVCGLRSQRVQCDEIWTFIYSKEKNVPFDRYEAAGDVWTWVGMDADSKMCVSWLVGNRDADTASIFMKDVASRLSNRVQLTTDGLKSYLQAVDGAFGNDIDFAQLVKIYGEQEGHATDHRYSTNECSGIRKVPICGNPDDDYISTSYIERQNLTMRMHMRRFTRLTNAFSKKMANHCHAIALHFVYYNFAKKHTTLKMTPAMAAGLMDYQMTIGDIVKLAYPDAH